MNVSLKNREKNYCTLLDAESNNLVYMVSSTLYIVHVTHDNIYHV